MKIIPVLDILNGKVVHAKAGKRNLYRPLKSPMFSTACPLDVIYKLEEMGFKELYLADLDSILNNQTNFSLLDQIRDTSKIELMVDAGVTTRDLANQLFLKNVKKVIIGTETLKSIKFLKDAINFFGKNRIIVSLDLIDNKILNKFNLKNQNEPLTFLRSLKDLNVSEIIVLDLTRVGSKRGVNNRLVKKILEESDFRIIIGGGIKDTSELIELRQMGVYGALLATALYSNTITVSNLKQKSFLTI
jgi:phosphoribosylformimino-5-aminoimidazole carboxamide ribotide isomerase